MNRRNTAIIVLALVLMILGFVGVLVVGQIVNPPSTPIAVAVVDIPIGTPLTRAMFAIDNVQMDPKVIAELIRESELDHYLGGVTVEPMRKYQPLTKAAVAVDGNPAAAHRLALSLSDPGLVAMVIPVSRETAPEAIVEGDYVDLSFGVRASSTYGARMSTSPTEAMVSFEPYSVLPEPLPLLATTEPTATPTIEPLLMLPVAKTIVSNAKVLAVIREERTVLTQDGLQSQTANMPGKIVGLVVAVPRVAQELVEFAIDNGIVRVALLSARIDGDTPPGEHRPTLGMTWNDLVSLLRMERERALAAGLPGEGIGPGAYAVEATRHAATQAAFELTRAAPIPTASPTATAAAE